MNDLISRQEAIVAICKAGCSLSNPCRVLCPDALAVQEVPSTNQWIPVTERLPDNEKDDWVLAVVREKDTGFCWIPRVMEYRARLNDWLFQNDYGWLSDERNKNFEVVAWMPAPEPYKGGKGMKEVEKKILPQFFEDVLTGRKTFEIRKDDDGVKVGDVLVLREYDGEKYTGRIVKRVVTYVLRDCAEYGLMDGFAVYGIQQMGVDGTFVQTGNNEEEE